MWIERAREHGDLKENADYHAAKDEHGLNEARIRQLEQMLKNAVVIESHVAGDVVEPGALVDLRYEGDDDVVDVSRRLDRRTPRDVRRALDELAARPGDPRQGAGRDRDVPGPEARALGHASSRCARSTDLARRHAVARRSRRRPA